jgi:L-seryl-tRNA(Ser) seleniumtransferase
MARAKAGGELRRIPSVDSLLRTQAARRACEQFGRPLVKFAVQKVLEAARGDAARGIPPPDDDILLARAARFTALNWYGLSPVLNATGVILHTGLGRAPLPDRAAYAAAEAARGYVDLEVDRETGARGRRTTKAENMLVALTGAAEALVVNNNAAALLLALTALARRREVPVSRGELIEIGGEFRLPDIMAASGAKLIEVGTTNRTRITDFRAAMNDKTGALLKVHPSNYRVTGFAETPPADQLAALATKHGVPFIFDVGSGLLDRFSGMPDDEPAATEALGAGADVVCFSGDKLLGGPQAGILLGRADLVESMRRNPLARALRVDKMQIAALEAVLRLYTTGRSKELPLWRLLQTPSAELKARASKLAHELPGAHPRKSNATVGGGSVPGYSVPSWAVEVSVLRPDAIATRLREGRPPVFCRVEDGCLAFDLRTIPAERDADLLRAIRYALEQA